MDHLSTFGDYASTKLQTAGSFISSHSPTIINDFCSKTGSLASSFFSECGNMLKSAGSGLKNRVLPFLGSKLSSAKEMIVRNPKIAGGVAIALVAVIGVATAAKYVMGKRNTGNSTENKAPVNAEKTTLEKIEIQRQTNREAIRTEKALGKEDKTKLKALETERKELRKAYVAERKKLNTNKM